MKRTVAAGLSVALMSGLANAAEPAPFPAAAPAMLPAAIRTPDVLPAAFYAPNFMGAAPPRAMPPAMTEPVWVSTKSPSQVVPASAIPPVTTSQPAATPTMPTVTPRVAPGPRSRHNAVEVNFAAPTIPQVPASSPLAPGVILPPMSKPLSPPMPPPVAPAEPTPPMPMTPPMAPTVVMEQPVAPTPRPIEVPTPKVEEVPAPRPAPQALPSPKETAEKPADQAELPTAPLAVLHSPGPGVPFHHGTFGSPPIRLSRDYPSLPDLIHYSHSQIDVGEEAVGPATDRAFVQVEYLLWRVNRDSIPVLGTTSIDGGEGYLGQPGTVPIVGPGEYGPTTRNGIRARAGAWINECGTCGIDGSVFVLGKQSNDTIISPAQFPIITRPIFVPNDGGFAFGEIVSRPNISVGTLTVQDESFLWGADVNFRKAICRQCNRQTEWFAGFRYLNLDESITISESLISLPGSTNPAGTDVFVQDSFSTRNDFYGGQVGGVWMRRWGGFDLYARGSIALGVTRQEVRVEGFQNVTPPGFPTSTFTGGLLATTTNIGTHTNEAFSAVPELTLNAGYWVTPHLKLYVGYNFLYWPNVVRPGGEIDTVVNLSNVPNPPSNVGFSSLQRPAVSFAETDLFINGVQFGVEYRW